MEFNEKTGWRVRVRLWQTTELTNFLLICNGPLLSFPLHFLVFVLPRSILILSFSGLWPFPYTTPNKSCTNPPKYFVQSQIPPQGMHLMLSPMPVYAIAPLVLCGILERVSSVNPHSGWVGCPSLMVLGVADLDG